MEKRLSNLFEEQMHQRALSVLAVGMLLPETVRQISSGFTGSSLLLVPALLSVSLRMRFPLAALLLQLAVAAAATILGNPSPLVFIGLTQICLLSIAELRGRTPVIVGAIAASVVLAIVVAFHVPEDFGDVVLSAYIYAVVAWTVVSVGIGVAIRAQRRYLRAVRELASRDIERQKLISRQLVVEERLRIARELHDSLAHHVAVVGMLTGLARTSLTTSQERTEEALIRSQEATRSILRELNDILGVLRDEDAENSSADRAQAGLRLDDVDDLIRSFRSIGLDVDAEIVGDRSALPVDASSTFYWVLREALTNAQKHGDGYVRVRVVIGGGVLEINVVNRLSATGNQITGTNGNSHFGLVGMRERVQALGGTIEHRVSGGEFRLHVEVPFDSSYDEDVSPGWERAEQA